MKDVLCFVRAEKSEGAEQPAAQRQTGIWDQAELDVLRQNSRALKVLCTELVHRARTESERANRLQTQLNTSNAELDKCALDASYMMLYTSVCNIQKELIVT